MTERIYTFPPLPDLPAEGDAFFGTLHVRHVARRRWRICNDRETPLFGMRDRNGRLIIPERDYETDLASVPGLLQWAFPPGGDEDGRAYVPAVVIHDKLYHDGKIEGEWITRREADDLMRRGMLLLDVADWVRRAMYAGVRAGGWFVWRRHGHGKPKDDTRAALTLDWRCDECAD